MRKIEEDHEDNKKILLVFKYLSNLKLNIDELYFINNINNKY